MKKAIFSILLFLFVLLVAGDMVTIFRVNNNSEQFGQVLPAYTLIYDREGKTLYQLTAKALATNTLSTATVVQADSAITASLEGAIHDSLSQDMVIIHNEITIRDTVHINNSKLWNNNGSLITDGVFASEIGISSGGYITATGLISGDCIAAADDITGEFINATDTMQIGSSSDVANMYVEGAVQVGSDILHITDAKVRIDGGYLQLVDENTAITGENDILYLEGNTVWMYNVDTCKVDGNITAGGNIYAGSEILAEKSFVTGNYTARDSSMCIIKTGDTLLVRTVFDETRDLVQKVRIKNEYVIDDNSTVNFWGTYLIPNTNAYTYAGMYASSVKIHANTDDAAPYKINDALFGGNHGFDYMRLVTSTGHGLTTTDVGSEWTDWSAVKYYPVRIVDENSFWLLSENSSATDVWSFDPDPDGNLWNGADSLMIESYGLAQMRPSIKDHDIKCYIDNTRLTDDGTYYCDNLTIDEYYAIPDPSACLDSLIAHAGEADNIYVNLGETHSMVSLSYKFDPYGCCVVNNNISIQKDISYTYITAGQAYPLTQGAYDSTYTYIPNMQNASDGVKLWYGSELNDCSSRPATGIIYSSDKWINTTFPPYRGVNYLGTSKSDIDVGFAIGINTLYGDGKPYNRNDYSSLCALGGKIYLYSVWYGSSLSAPLEYSCQIYRKYFNPKELSNDSRAYIVDIGGDAILETDYTSTTSYDTLNIPIRYKDFNAIELYDNDSITAYSYNPSGSKMIVSNTDNGLLTMLFSQKQESSQILNTQTKGVLAFDIDTVKIESPLFVDGTKLRTADYTTLTRIGLNTGTPTGINNTIYGYNAGNASTTCTDNIFIGYDAGVLNTSGSGNTIIGSNAGTKVTTNNSLTLYGYQAGYNATGEQNTMIGSTAGRSTTSGKHNTTIGYGSGYSNSTGHYNTYLGHSAGYSGTSPWMNAFLGYQTGYRNKTGQYNTYIGGQAGYDNLSGHRNIIIGNYKGYASLDSMIYIDNTGKDSTATPLITGNMTSGVANRGVTIDGYVYKKKEPFAKFKRTTTFTPTAADTWLRVPICEPSGLHNTPHFTCAADSSIIIGRAMMLDITSAVKKYIGVNTVEKVLFRLVKGAISGGRTYSICGQQKENIAQAVGDEFTVAIPTSDMGFAAGDSLWLEMKTTDVGIILKPDTDFNNPASASMNLKYLFDL